MALIACESGLRNKREGVTVKLKGGDRIVNDKGDNAAPAGNASLTVESAIAY